MPIHPIQTQSSQPTDWTPFDTYPGTWWWETHTYYNTSSSNAHSGSCSLQSRTEYGYANSYTEPSAWAQDSFVKNIITSPATENTFQISVWVKAGETTEVTLCLYGYEPGYGRVSKGALSEVFTIGTAWTQITHECTFGPEVTELSLALIRPPQTSPGQIWFDDIEVSAR